MRTPVVLLVVSCLLSGVSAQWLERTIYVPDSLVGVINPRALAYRPISGTY